MRGWLETAIQLWPWGRASDSLMPPPEKPWESPSHQARSLLWTVHGMWPLFNSILSPSPGLCLPASSPTPTHGQGSLSETPRAASPLPQGKALLLSPAKRSPLWSDFLWGYISHSSLSPPDLCTRSFFLLVSCPSLYLSHKSQMGLTSSLKPSFNGSPEVWVRAPQVPGTHPLRPPPCPDGWLRGLSRVRGTCWAPTLLHSFPAPARAR